MHASIPYALTGLALLLPISDVGTQAKKKKTADGFSLEQIFPDKGLFGPSASSMSFSHDGRYAAWLWRPRHERRHGSDLWILDVKSGKRTRLTSASIMAAFRKSAREVVEDRKKKAAAFAKETAAATASKSAKTKAAKSKDGKKRDKVRLIDGILSDDHDAKKAPRYSGVRRYTWSPTANELLFVSGSDVYSHRVGKAIERMTFTREAETSVQYLPDGSGYTFLRGDGLYRVRFGRHVLEQIDPPLPAGERMTGYRMSPDGKTIVCVARKGVGRRGGNRTVKIASYRSRFMNVREVPRHVSDDPFPPTETVVYLFSLDEDMAERSQAVEVFRRAISGPRDMLRVPHWSPDSSRVVFAHFEQKSSEQQILIASMPKVGAAKTDPQTTAKKAPKPSTGEMDLSKAKSADAKPSAATADAKPAKAPARVAYRWLHDGGPTTPRMIEPRFEADNRHVVCISEMTGFRHIHRIDPLYQTQRALTSGHYEVYPFGMSKDHKTLWVLSTREHSTRQDVYAIDLEAKPPTMRRLTDEIGTYSSAAVAPNGQTVLANFTRFGAPRELKSIHRTKRRQTWTKSHSKAALELAARRPEFFSYENRHGHRIHGYMFTPKGYSRETAKTRKSGRPPLLVYVYGGPLGTRKNVVEGSYSSDGYFFNQYMTREHGYITCVIDPRGMSGYGALFEKANFEQVGKPQVEDLVDGVKHLVAKYGADAKRVGIHGWSFGGFQTQMCLYTAPETFQVGMAGAGPTEWENYNSWYSTGTIGKSRQGTSKPDLEKYSLLPLAKNLKGKLLLVHGMEDANVLYQDTVRIYRKLLEAGKETNVELFVDPTGGHGLGGDVKRLGKARKYEDFLLRTLGRGTRYEENAVSEGSPEPSDR